MKTINYIWIGILYVLISAPFTALGGESMSSGQPIMHPDNASLYKINPGIHPVIRSVLNHYLDSSENLKTNDQANVSEDDVLRQVTQGPAEVPFIPLNSVQYQLSDYFPLYYGTRWEYTVNGYLNDTAKVLSKSFNVNGVMTKIIKHKAGLKEYYTNDSNGIMLHRLYQPDVSIPNIGTVDFSLTFIPPIQIVGGMVNIGETFQSNGIIKTNSLPTVGVMRLPYNSSFSIDSAENITVPGGNFDVVKISGNITLIDETVSTTYYMAEDIGIVKEDSAGDTSELDAVYYINLVSPSEEEVLPSGETYTINWEATSYTEYFELFYSTNNGITWKTMTPDLITGVSYDWEVPPQKKNKSTCLLKIIGYNSDGIKKTSVASKPFTIEVVKLISPDGGEVLTSNTSWPVVWNTNATKTPVTSVVLKYTLNQGRTWKTLAKIAGSDPGTYDWNIPVVSREKTKCRVEVILQDANGRTIGTDMSDDYFTITP